MPPLGNAVGLVDDKVGQLAVPVEVGEDGLEAGRGRLLRRDVEQLRVGALGSEVGGVAVLVLGQHLRVDGLGDDPVPHEVLNLVLVNKQNEDDAMKGFSR